MLNRLKSVHSTLIARLIQSVSSATPCPSIQPFINKVYWTNEMMLTNLWGTWHSITSIEIFARIFQGTFYSIITDVFLWLIISGLSWSFCVMSIGCVRHMLDRIRFSYRLLRIKAHLLSLCVAHCLTQLQGLISVSQISLRQKVCHKSSK